MENDNVLVFKSWVEVACFFLFCQATGDATADLLHLAGWMDRPHHPPSAATILASLTLATVYLVVGYLAYRRREQKTPAPGTDLR